MNSPFEKYVVGDVVSFEHLYDTPNWFIYRPWYFRVWWKLWRPFHMRFFKKEIGHYEVVSVSGENNPDKGG